jgi:Zn-dependent metalloprotease/ligand-binding sensor domain-containing protein
MLILLPLPKIPVMRSRFVLYCVLIFLMEITSSYSISGQASTGTFSKTILYFPSSAPSAAELLQNTNLEQLGFSPTTALRLLRSYSDKNGWIHYRCQVSREGLDILGAEIILHEYNGSVRTANGWQATDFPIVNDQILDEEAAMQIALSVVDAKEYAWENPDFENAIKQVEQDPMVTSFPQPKLLLSKMEAENLRRAFKIDILLTRPSLLRRTLLIDASTGAILKDFVTSQSCTSPTSGISNYVSSPVHFLADSCGGDFFRLRDEERGIETYNAIFTESNPLLDFTNSTDSWTQEELRPGVDAHWAMTQFYDYFNENFNWKSFDGQDSKMLAWVNYGLELNNAQWIGNWANFGPGNGIDYHTFTSLDIVGHEFGHGLIQHTANLIPEGESGALNEGFCDIIGAMVEFTKHPDGGNWQTGEAPSLLSCCIRDMENPNSIQYPDTYLGDFWATQEDCNASPINDNCHIHQNSTVIGHWFYLLSEGGNGQNDHGTDYELSGIGLEKSANLVFHSLQNYLTPTDGFYHVRLLTILAATQLGYSDGEIEQIYQAWCAVGVGPCDADNFAPITLLTPNGNGSYQSGEQIDITWSYAGNLPSFILQFSINGGVNWSTIVEDLPNDGTGAYPWTVPNLNSPFCKVRILSPDNPLVGDASDFNFSINGCSSVAHFNINSSSLCVGESLIALNTSLPQAVDFEWKINGELVSINADSIHYTFTEAGQYVITLRTFSNEDCIDQFEKTIQVSPSPNAEFEAILSNQYLFASAQEGMEQYIWTLNGELLNLTTPDISIELESTGIFQLQLTVIDQCGAQSSVQELNLEEQEECFGNTTGWRQLSYLDHISAITRQNETLWIGTPNGLIEYHLSSQTTSHFNIYNSGLLSNSIKDIEIGPQGKIWIGTSNGISVYDGIQWEAIGMANGLSDINISDLLFDKQDQLWAATSGGLFALQLSTPPEAVYTPSPSDGFEYSNFGIIRQSTDSVIWVTSGFHVLSRLKNGVWEHFKPDNSPLTYSEISDLSVDANDYSIWISTNTNGLFHFDGENNWDHFLQEDNTGLTSNKLSVLHLDTTGLLWVAPLDEANFFSFDGNQFIPQSIVASDEVRINTFFDLAPDQLLVGSTKGLYQWTTGTSQKIEFGIPQIPDATIYDIYFEDNGPIWVCTDKGLVRINGETIDVFTTDNSNLPTNFIYTIQIDADGVKWIGTLKGIVRYNDATWVTFFEDQAVYSSFKVNGQKLWFGGYEHIYQLESGSWEFIAANQYQELEGGRIDELIEDQYGTLWYRSYHYFYPTGTSHRVYTFNEDQISQKLQVDGILTLGPYLWGMAYADDFVVWINEPPHNFLNPDYPGHIYKYDILGDSLLSSAIDDVGYRYKAAPNNDIYASFGKSIGILDSTESVLHISSLHETDLPIRYFELTPSLSIWAANADGLRIYETSDSLLQPSFTYEATVCEGTNQLFQNTTPGASSFLWLINEDTISNQENLEYQFEAPGNYLVTLIATNETDCRVAKTELVNVHPMANLPDSWEAYLDICDNSFLLESKLEGMAQYEWIYEGSLVGTESNYAATASGNYALQMEDHCGNSVSISTYLLLDQECVWPGDANNDGIVNIYDLLKIGEIYGRSGIPRSEVSGFFEGYPAADWTGDFWIDGTNQKYADANGDGWIDQSDYLIIEENYRKTHGVGYSDPSSEISPVNLQAAITQLPHEGNNGQMVVDILIMNEDVPYLDQLYGVAFKLDYDIPGLEFATPPIINFANSDLGESPAEVLSISEHSPNEPVIEAAITRIDHLNHPGVSIVGQADFIVIGDNIPTGDTIPITFQFKGTRAVSKDGSIIPLGAPTQEFLLIGNTVTTNKVTSKTTWTVGPNPSSGRFWLKAEGHIPEQTTIQVISSHGILMKTLSHKGPSKMVDLSGHPPGVYFLRIETKHDLIIKKVIKI